MPERTPIAVETMPASGEAEPRALWISGTRHRVVSVIRQWDQGQECRYELQLDDGHTAITGLDRRTGDWYLVDMRGRARPA